MPPKIQKTEIKMLPKIMDKLTIIVKHGIMAHIEWNLVNLTSNRPQKSGHNI